jgi:hypothetical protein
VTKSAVDFLLQDASVIDVFEVGSRLKKNVRFLIGGVRGGS